MKFRFARWSPAGFVLLSACALVAGGTPPPPTGSGPAPASEGPSSAPSPGIVPGEPAPGVPLAAPAVTPAGARARTRVGAETRALWVTRSTLADPDSIRIMVGRAGDLGFNVLLVQVRGRGDALFLGGREPRSPLLAGRPPEFDPLGVVIREAHRRGIEVHAWVNTHLVSSAVLLPQEEGHLVNRRPEWLAVHRDLSGRLLAMDPGDPAYLDSIVRHARANRDRIEGLYTGPAIPEVQDHVVEIWREILVRYPVDGVHLDYIRFPGPDFDRSAASLGQFRSWVREHFPGDPAPPGEDAAPEELLAWVDAHPERWSEFRRESVTALVRRISSEVRRIRPRATISAAVFPGIEDAYSARFQDWGLWLREGSIDVVVPMAYTADDAIFRSQLERAIGEGGAERVWMGVGIYQNPVDGAGSKIRMTRNSGAAGFSVFSYDWAFQPTPDGGGGTYLEGIRPLLMDSGGTGR